MSQMERQMEILQILSMERQTTARQLAEHFGVCEKTIRRDIETLTLSYPIFPISGIRGGFRVMDGWYASRTYLSKSEEAFLQRLLPGLQPEDQETMMSILRKFSK